MEDQQIQQQQQPRVSKAFTSYFGSDKKPFKEKSFSERLVYEVGACYLGGFLLTGFYTTSIPTVSSLRSCLRQRVNPFKRMSQERYEAEVAALTPLRDQQRPEYKLLLQKQRPPLFFNFFYSLKASRDLRPERIGMDLGLFAFQVNVARYFMSTFFFGNDDTTNYVLLEVSSFGLVGALKGLNPSMALAKHERRSLEESRRFGLIFPSYENMKRSAPIFSYLHNAITSFTFRATPIAINACLYALLAKYALDNKHYLEDLETKVSRWAEQHKLSKYFKPWH